MASLADLNLPNNIVYDERTKRYHDLFQNYRMVGASRVAAMGAPQRADRSEQYVTRQEFFNMRTDLYRFISHTTELTREALQALFEMQRSQLRDTERLAENERDNIEERSEKKPSLIGRLAGGAMERVGSAIRARPGLSLMSILGAALIGFIATPNETVQRFGNTIDELVSTITNMTDILRQIALAAGVLGGIELARRVAQRFNRPSTQTPSRPGPGAPTGSRPTTSSTPRSSVPSIPSTSTPPSASPSASSPQSGSPSRLLNPRLTGPLAAVSTAVQMANANQMLRQGNINREEHRRLMGSAIGGLLGALLGSRAGIIGQVILGQFGSNIGQEIAEIINRSQRPPTTPQERQQQAAQEEQQLRERAANTPPGSLERRSLERVEAQNMIRTAQQEQRITQAQAQAISLEMGRGGIYQNRREEVARALREGGNLEISPEVARRLNLPSQATQPGGRPSITVMPPVAVPAPAQPQQQPTPRQQPQSPVMGLQIRNPEQAMFEALIRQALPS